MSARTQLAEQLATKLPTFRVVKEESVPDQLTKGTVVVRFHGYAPAPNAQGTMIANFIVTVISHHTDFEKAEDHLDELLPDVLSALSTADDGITWTDASKVLVSNTWLGFDVSASFYAARIY